MAAHKNTSATLPDILYIFRKPQATYFSLERVFGQLARSVSARWKVASFSVPHARPRPWNILMNCLAARRQKAGIYHVTGDVHYVTLALPGKRTILTMHDLAVMHRKTGFRRLLFKYLYLVWPVRHCRYITCISEKTKEDILRFTGCAPERVVVIPNPVDEGCGYSEKTFNETRPVILFVGTAPHKNLARAIEALRDIPCLLDVVGRIPEAEKQRMKELNIAYRESWDLSNEELVARYRDCDLVLFPTLFEGFGLPILEAQQSGRPLVTSRRSPMQEVAGKGACLVDPDQAVSIREAVLRVIQDADYRKELIRTGMDNASQYSASAIATRYEKLYQSILP